ncbi:MAG: glycosyltransferase family 2 protein [Bacteroidota bacterium]
MEWVFWISWGFLFFRTGIATWNVFLPPKLSQRKLDERKLSILVPARNEVDALPNLISQLQKLTYSDYEVIVLNDNSSDGTEALLMQISQQWESLTYINGSSLPEDWLGKNWACHQLSEAASGHYFLYLDADVAYIEPDLPQRAIATLELYELDLLSIFPTQLMPSLGEKAIVPLMHYLLLSLLPLSWIRLLPFPSMAAANGQFMLFNADTYQKYSWHKRVKKEIVEDIAIMQAVKTEKGKGMTLLGENMIKCRMYEGFVSGIDGFGKNLLAGFGNQLLFLAVYLFLILFSWVILVIEFSSVQLLGFIAIIIWMRICTHFASKESLWVHVLLHPIHMLSLFVVACNSGYRKLSGKNIWKGRNIAIK